MKTYIDERPWEVMIAESVTPTGKHEEIVQMILRNNRVFDGNQTIYDHDVYSRQSKIKQLEFDKAILEKAMQSANDKREQVRELLQKRKEYQNEIDSTPHHKRAQVKELENIKEEIEKRVQDLLQSAKQIEDQTTEKLNDICTEIAKLEISLEIWTTYQDIAQKEFVSLRRGIQEYKRKNDIEFLRKAVHWTCEYANKLTAPLPKFN